MKKSNKKKKTTNFQLSTEHIIECLKDGRINIVDNVDNNTGVMFSVGNKTFTPKMFGVENLTARDFFFNISLDKIVSSIYFRIVDLKNENKNTYKYVEDVLSKKISHKDMLLQSLGL